MGQEIGLAFMLVGAAYFAGVPLCEGTLSDQPRGQYDFATHTLAGLDSTEVGGGAGREHFGKLRPEQEGMSSRTGKGRPA